MSQIDEQIAALKAKREAAQLQMVRSQTLRENAEKLEAEMLQRLKDEFGLDNLADARAKLDELDAEVRRLMEEISEDLNKIN